MAKFRLSPTAQRELEEIGNATRERWGTAQATKYLSHITSRIKLAAENPLLGKNQGEYGAGLRSISSGRHRIFYRQTSEGIEVQRILHNARSLDNAFSREQIRQRQRDRDRDVVSIFTARAEIARDLYAARAEAAVRAETLKVVAGQAPGDAARARAASKATLTAEWLKSDRGPDFQLKILREVGVTGLYVPHGKSDTALDRVMAISGAARRELKKIPEQQLARATEKVLARDLSR